MWARAERDGRRRLHHRRDRRLNGRRWRHRGACAAGCHLLLRERREASGQHRQREDHTAGRSKN